MRHRVMVTTLFTGDNTLSKAYYFGWTDIGKPLY